MAGTKSGGEAAAQTNKAKYGSDFYQKIGAKGGRLGHTGGFAANRELARAAGSIGGKVSKKGIPVTHCGRGHEFNEENTYTSPSGQRACRTCQQITRHQRALRAQEALRASQR